MRRATCLRANAFGRVIWSGLAITAALIVLTMLSGRVSTTAFVIRVIVVSVIMRT
jgi:hypothetical protein